MAQEIELKLAFPAAALDAVRAHPRLTSARRIGSAQTLINTYFDTPDLALSARRIALRTRKAGNVWLQTVKCAAESLGGLSSRPEWEQPYHGKFDFSAIEAVAVREKLEHNQDDLVPLFTTNFVRDTFELRDGATCIHVMVDCGEVSAGKRQEAINELELELVSGEPDALFALACELAADLPLIPFDPSKAARGYRLFRRKRLKPMPAQPLAPHPDTPAVDAFRAAALHCIAAWAANHHGASQDADAEFVHQMHIALSRLRTLLKLFARALPDGFGEPWRTTLRAHAAAAGALRDIQVLRDSMLAQARTEDGDARLEPLSHAIEQLCAERAAALRAGLAAPGAGLAMLQLTRALHQLPSPDTLPLSGPVLRAALRKLHRQARHRLEQAAERQTHDALHALRIRIKQLRLNCELTTPAEHKKPSRNTRKLAKLQGRLGDLHDLAMAMPLLARLVREQPQLGEGVAFLCGFLAATSLKLRHTILRRARRVLRDSHWHDELHPEHHAGH